VFEAAGGQDALDTLRANRIDLIIVDLSMPGMTGLDLIRLVRAGFTLVRILVLSMHDGQQYALRALRAGREAART
jgi:YesN/AraC family two-component response regulator